MDKARLYCRPDLPWLEHLHAHFELYHYSRHAHAGLVIGLVDEGIQSYSYRGARHCTGTDGIFFVNAGEAHTGEPADEKGYTYRAIRLDSAFVAEFLGGAGARCLVFKEAVVHSPRLARKLRTALLAIERGAPALQCEELLLDSLGALAKRHADSWSGRDYRCANFQAIERGREFIASSRVQDLSLAQLGDLAGLSLFHFAHAFRRQVGCSPFLYAEALRIDRAKRRLRHGDALVEIALDLGYTDQSHFTRKFKKHEGVTPGEYRRWTSSLRNRC